MSQVSSHLVAALALAGTLAGGSAWASWPGDPTANVPVCTASGAQDTPVSAPDGHGGVLVAWQDSRNSSFPMIYAQHVTGAGVPDPAWPANGRVLCSGNHAQYFPVIVGDGAGGAIVAWMDFRVTSYDIYAQHVLAGGTIDPAWPADGAAVCTADNGQFYPAIAADGVGGAIVAWEDLRHGAATHDIFAQHVLASGAMDPGWPANGRAMCPVDHYQYHPVMTADGAGGAIVAWQDVRTTADIYAQHVLASGAVDPAWPADALALCAAAGDQLAPAIAADGAGGAIVAWEDPRGGGTSHDIYAQHALATGSVDSGWPTDGQALCTAAGGQVAPQIVPDGAGGGIVAWEDGRGGSTDDVYAAHVLATGGTDTGWPANGAAVCASTHGQYTPALVGDGAGGAIVAWKDFRGATNDVYAQHLLAAGTRDPAWPANGTAVSTAANDQILPCVVGDGAQGAIVAWKDNRTDAQYDVYAQRVQAGGTLGGDLTAVSPEAPAFVIAAYPDPARGLIRFGAPGAGAADRVEVLDPEGRLVWSARLGGGEVAWAGTTASGRRASPGAYFARFHLRGGLAVRRFIWLR